jgi:hypothetical protein
VKNFGKIASEARTKWQFAAAWHFIRKRTTPPYGRDPTKKTPPFREGPGEGLFISRFVLCLEFVFAKFVEA